MQQYHTRAEGVALGHRCRKSQSNPIYQLCLLKGRADAAVDFYFTDLTPGFMGRIQPHIAGHHLNKYLSCWKRPGRQVVCLAPCSPSSLSQLHTGSLTVTRRVHPSILLCYRWAGERSLPGTRIHQFSSRQAPCERCALRYPGLRWEPEAICRPAPAQHRAPRICGSDINYPQRKS